jgi:hypothetical protein
MGADKRAAGQAGEEDDELLRSHRGQGGNRFAQMDGRNQGMVDAQWIEPWTSPV